MTAIPAPYTPSQQGFHALHTRLAQEYIETRLDPREPSREDSGPARRCLADDPSVFFTTPHFDGHPSILVRLDRIGLAELDEVIVEAWLCRAPKRLAREYIDTRLDSRGK